MSAITTLQSILGNRNKTKPARAYLIPLNYDDTWDDKGGRSFQYFPETIQDNRATTYQPKEVMGLSHPLYSWTSGGQRSISFTAVFSRDEAISNSPVPTKAIKASNFILGGVPSIRDAVQESINSNSDETWKNSLRADARNVFIPSVISWLRSFTYPEYTEKFKSSDENVYTVSKVRPPRKLILGLPGVRLNDGRVSELPPSEMFCLMAGCDAEYTSFFPDGTPRIAKVNLEFFEIIQVNGVKPHDGLRMRGYASYGFKRPVQR